MSDSSEAWDLKKMSESKRALRRELMDLPILEKLRILDVLHERAIAIRGQDSLPKKPVAPSDT